MAVKEDKCRVQVTLPKEVAAKLDEVCTRTGLSRSGFVSYTVAMALDSYDGLIKNGAAALVRTAEE